MTIPFMMLLLLLITIIIETMVALIIKIRNIRDITNIILVNILTNPLLVSLSYLIMFRFGMKIKIVADIIMEIIVFVVEGIIYKKYLKYDKKNPFEVSLILNISSFFLGSFIVLPMISNSLNLLIVTFT